MKFKKYEGQTLTNATVSYKIDGVRAHNTPDGPVSRAGKPLYNLTLPDDIEVAEIYGGTWEQTISMVRTQVGAPVPESAIYSLRPNIDKRLVIGVYDTITPMEVAHLFDVAKLQKLEGLIIESEGLLYKVKGTETFDVPVIGVQEGTGRNLGRMGALLTPMGKVGGGFTDAHRELYYKDIIGKIIEVECMELTPDGKFRHPRFVRLREDKA